jgi:drug/metabolite transporter (DMT)-like permease
MADIACEYTDRYGYVEGMTSKYTNPVAGSVLVLCWSSGFIGAVLATRQTGVDTVLFWRTVVAATVLGLWAVARRERVSRAAFGKLVVLGLLVQVVYLGGIFGATAAGVDAGTCALIAALQPLVVAQLAGPVLGERTTPRQRLGLLIGAAGVVLVVAGDVGSGHAPAWAYGLPVLAVAGLSAGTVLERRWRPEASVPVALGVQTGTAAVAFAVFAAVDGGLTPPTTVAFAGAIGWLVVLASLGGYGSYLFVVRRSGATRASTLLYLTPPTSALAAWAMFGQEPGPTTGPGLLVCAAGVALALTSRGRGRRRSAGQRGQEVDGGLRVGERDVHGVRDPGGTGRQDADAPGRRSCCAQPADLGERRQVAQIVAEVEHGAGTRGEPVEGRGLVVTRQAEFEHLAARMDLQRQLVGKVTDARFDTGQGRVGVGGAAGVHDK